MRCSVAIVFGLCRVTGAELSKGTASAIGARVGDRLLVSNK